MNSNNGAVNILKRCAHPKYMDFTLLSKNSHPWALKQLQKYCITNKICYYRLSSNSGIFKKVTYNINQVLMSI